MVFYPHLAVDNFIFSTLLSPLEKMANFIVFSPSADLSSSLAAFTVFLSTNFVRLLFFLSPYLTFWATSFFHFFPTGRM